MEAERRIDLGLMVVALLGVGAVALGAPSLWRSVLVGGFGVLVLVRAPLEIRRGYVVIGSALQARIERSRRPGAFWALLLWRSLLGVAMVAVAVSLAVYHATESGPRMDAGRPSNEVPSAVSSRGEKGDI